MKPQRALILRVIATGIALLTMTGLIIGQGSSDALEQGFRHRQTPRSPWSGGTG